MTPNIKMIKKYGIPKVQFYIKNIMNFIGPRKRSKQGPTKPLLTPTCAPKSATENHHFWEASIASPENRLPLSQAKREKFPSLHTPYWCNKIATENHHFWEASIVSPVKRLSLSRA